VALVGEARHYALVIQGGATPIHCIECFASGATHQLLIQVNEILGVAARLVQRIADTLPCAMARIVDLIGAQEKLFLRRAEDAHPDVAKGSKER
jgi:hypothetical protein